jgi:hypothetical protein
VRPTAHFYLAIKGEPAYLLPAAVRRVKRVLFWFFSDCSWPAHPGTEPPHNRLRPFVSLRVSTQRTRFTDSPPLPKPPDEPSARRGLGCNPRLVHGLRLHQRHRMGETHTASPITQWFNTLNPDLQKPAPFSGSPHLAPIWPASGPFPYTSSFVNPAPFDPRRHAASCAVQRGLIT